MTNTTDELEGFTVAPEKTDDEEVVASLGLEKRMFKLRKKLADHADVVEDMEVMDAEDLRSRILQSDSNIHESELARDRDPDVKLYKDKLKEAQAPYNEAKKVQKALADYALCLLDKMGKL